MSYFTGSAGSRAEVAQAVVDDQTGQVLGAWHDHQLDAPLARGYSGAIAQKVNAPYVWLPLCLLFLAPFFDPRRPFRLLHLDLLVLLGLGVSLFFFNRGEITASVPLTYPVLGYVFARMLWVGVRPRDRAGPLIPVLAGQLAGDRRRSSSPCGRIALNVADSHVIDIGVAGVVGADHITHGQELYNGDFAPGVGIRGDVYGPFNYLAYVPFEAAFPWDGHWGDVPAAHAAAIAFDLLTALGLLALGRRLRPGRDGRTLGVALAFAWLAYPFTLYTMNANANDSLIAAIGGRGDAGPDLAAGPGSAGRRWRAAAKFGLGGAGAAVRHRHRRAPLALARSSSRSPSWSSPRVLVAALPSRRRPARALRPHARLPGLAKLAVQRLGPGAVARLPAADRAGGSDRRSRSRSRFWPAPKDAGPGRRAGGGGADRRPARRDALVLLLRRLVPAAGARGAVRGAARRGPQPILVSQPRPGSAS